MGRNGPTDRTRALPSSTPTASVFVPVAVVACVAVAIVYVIDVIAVGDALVSAIGAMRVGVVLVDEVAFESAFTPVAIV
jgi:hypothetical protein